MRVGVGIDPKKSAPEPDPELILLTNLTFHCKILFTYEQAKNVQHILAFCKYLNTRNFKYFFQKILLNVFFAKCYF